MFQSVYKHWSQKRVQKTARALANRLGIPKRFLRAGINITQCFGEHTEYSVFYDRDSAINENVVVRSVGEIEAFCEGMNS